MRGERGLWQFANPQCAAPACLYDNLLCLKVYEDGLKGQDKMRDRLSLKTMLGALALLGLAISGAAQAQAQAQQSRPNVVIFIVDDLGWRDVGFMGSDFYETPHVDKLAAEGLIFSQAYSASPVCSPSRAAIMTGMDPARFGITDWIPGFVPKHQVPLVVPPIPHELPLEAVTLGEYFRAAGYATFYSGKWHLGSDAAHWPKAQGFDGNAGGFTRGQPVGKGKSGAYFSPHNNPALSDGPDGEFLTERLGRETTAFIAANAQRPFLAVHAFYQVHTPIEAAPDHIAHFEKKAVALGPDVSARSPLRYGEEAKGRQDNATYASMVAAMDAVVGQVVAQLEEAGVLDNTIILFTSDNGGLSHWDEEEDKPFAWKSPTSVMPLRGSKGWLYEGGIRVPLIIRAPERFGVTGVDHALATSADIVPTLLSLAGIASETRFDGVDLLQPEAADGRALAWHFPHYHGNLWRPGGAIRDERYKLIEFFEDGALELYDLKADPGETRDLASQRPDVAEKLRARLRTWRQQVGARMPQSR